MNERFGKSYKLCSQKLINAIFEKKKSIRCYPFVVHYALMGLPDNIPFQVTISAPKRTFKKAHDRNRIKRVMREAIRKNKLNLEPYLIEHNLQVALFMIYTAKEELDHNTLDKKTKQLFKQLIDEISKNQPS
jgi:ribonuclease P protein component